MFFGGLLFGYGMVLSNGCGSRALVLLGRGNLRSFVVVIVLAIAAQMTLKGLIAPAPRRSAAGRRRPRHRSFRLPALLSAFGIGETFARMLAASAISGALIIFAFAHAPFQRAWGQIAAGIAVGLLVAAGWFATGYLGADDFNPAAVTSLTFIAPIADTVQYVMLSTGLTLNFGIAMVAGVFAGSLLTALVTRRFQLEGFNSPRHMLRSIGGAALMGAGGVMAYGCSIGQGLTGLSTLALASFVAVGGILLGSAAGLRGVLRVQPLVSAQDARGLAQDPVARADVQVYAPDRQSAACVTIRISEVRVRCTGHLSAISINFLRCSASSAPSIDITRSIWSSMPTLVSHSAQSSA